MSSQTFRWCDKVTRYYGLAEVLGGFRRSAFKIENKYKFLLAQKLILQLRIEAVSYGKDVVKRAREFWTVHK